MYNRVISETIQDVTSSDIHRNWYFVIKSVKKLVLKYVSKVKPLTVFRNFQK